ncbi:hypothetical protein GIB67_038175, partial [Kingdonia uniflora]
KQTRKTRTTQSSFSNGESLRLEGHVADNPAMSSITWSPTVSLDWKFSQVFGEPNPGEEVQDIDVISAIDFEKRGDYIATGDKGGRVVIFEKTDVSKDPSRKELEPLDYTAKRHPEYRYKTEFQSHEPEFDYLKSVEIEEKINKVKWCAKPNESMFLLSTNDKTIKLWKVKDQKVKKVKEMEQHPSICLENALLAEKSCVTGQHETSVANNYRLEWTNKMSPFSQNGLTKIEKIREASPARRRRVFAHAHDYNINSISNNRIRHRDPTVNCRVISELGDFLFHLKLYLFHNPLYSDGETFISADDLRINLWNLEISDQCFNIVDMKPSKMEDLIEVITSAEFHPAYCNILAYSSSRGIIRLVDMRQSALCDQHARIFQDREVHGPKTFFTEIVASISDIKFANDGRHILSRDYMTLKLWDLNKEASPIATFKVQEHLRPKLSDVYNNDSIFDKFECCLSGDGLHFATGSYRFVYLIKMKQQHIQTHSKTRQASLSNLTHGHLRHGHGNSNSTDNGAAVAPDFNSKLLHIAWHPKRNVIACAVANSLYMYHA